MTTSSRQLHGPTTSPSGIARRTQDHVRLTSGANNVAGHRTDLLNGDVRSVIFTLYRAVPTAKKFAVSKIGILSKYRMIESSNNRMGVPFVSFPKKNGTLQFCADYWKPNAVPTAIYILSFAWTNVPTAWERRQRFQHWTPIKGYER